MLTKLVRECRKYLSEGLSVDNVIQVLEQSSLFGDNELKNKCLAQIAYNAKVVLTGAEILSTSPQTMETILNMDKLLVKEIVLYETCVAWAAHQLQIQRSTENSTDEMIREILGDLLYKIRFPTMDATEFAEISECRRPSILTEKEKTSIYYFLVTNKKCSRLMFSTERRRLGEEIWVERAVTCLHGPWMETPSPAVNAINFSTDHNILLTGVGLYMGFAGAGYEVDVEILHSNNSLFKKKLTVPATGDGDQFKVPLDVPVFMKSGYIYSVKTVPYERIRYYSDPCRAMCKKDNVIFTFSNHPDSKKTNAIYGQIPRLYFCI